MYVRPSTSDRETAYARNPDTAYLYILTSSTLSFITRDFNISGQRGYAHRYYRPVTGIGNEEILHL